MTTKYQFDENYINAAQMSCDIEERMEQIAADYKGLVKKQSFSNIAFDMWEQVNGEEGNAYPSKGDKELF